MNMDSVLVTFRVSLDLARGHGETNAKPKSLDFGCEDLGDGDV